MTGDGDSGGVAAIDLTVHGRALRLSVDDADSRAALAAEFDGRPSDDSAPTAFASRVPADTTKLHVVMDRSGFVLGRTRDAGEAHGVLRRHLEVFAPAPAGATRLRLRALVSDDGNAVLAAFPLFTEPAPVERRLSREGFRLVDRLSVDVGLGDPADPRLLPSTAPATDAPPCPGHAASPDSPAPITAMLVPGEPGLTTTAQVVALLAELADDDRSHDDRLDAAESLARLPTRTVPAEPRAARYAALR